MKMDYYKASWVLSGTGMYVTEDIGGGGGYYMDEYESQIIMAKSKAQVTRLIKKAYPCADKVEVELLEVK